MELLNIRRAFEKELASITNPSLIETAYENVKFESTDKPYQRVQLFMRDTLNPTYGDSYYREVGEFQVFLCYPKNQGAQAIYTRASEIRDHFHRGKSLVEDGTTVIVEKTPQIDTGVVIDDRYIVPVLISYFCSVLK